MARRAVDEPETGRRRSGAGTPPIYNAKLNRWQAYFTDRDGRRRTIVATLEEACRGKWERAMADDAAATLPDPHRLTVEKYFTDYVENFVKAKRSAATYSQYESLLRVHLYPALGSTPLKSLTHRDLQRLYDRLEQEGRHPTRLRTRPSAGQKHASGLAPKSIRSLQVAVHAGLSRAMRERLISTVRNPADAELLELPKVPRRKRMKIALADVRRFVESLLSEPSDRRRVNRRRYLFILLLNTGLRVSEALALQWANVELDVPCLHVDENAKRDTAGARVVGDPKTDAGYRTIPLTAAAVEALAAQKKLLADDRAKLGEAYEESSLVFPNALGGYDDRDHVRRAIKIAAKTAGLPNAADFTTHDTRRLCASLLCASGVRIEVAMSIMGHRNATMLLEVYATAVDENVREAAKLLQNYVYGHAET